MVKIIIVLLVAATVSSSFINLVDGNDDEFAEFDEFSSDEVVSKQAESVTKPSILESKFKDQKQRSQPEAKDQGQTTSPGASPSKPDPEQLETPEDSGKKPDLKLVDVPSLKQFKLESYYIEIGFILATFLYLINFFLGSAKNYKFAQEWYEQSRDILKQQFSLVGGSPTINEGAHKRDDDSEALLASLKKQKGLIKSSESLFTIWNSGRVGMDGLLVEINLLKRQDLFSMALNLIKVSKDNLILRFLLSNDQYENFVFCIAHKTQANRLVRDMVDINSFCPKRKMASQYAPELEKLVVMSELSDVASFIFDQKTTTFLKKYERSINYIHITDRYSTDRSEDISPMQKLALPKRMATFSFSFPKKAEERLEFITFSLSLLDRLRKFKLARDSKQKSDKNRQKITEYLQKTAFNLRQEAAQAKKEELRRLEKERIYNEDDPEKQRRWEKKEAKREQKRNKMRVKQLKVKSI